RSRISAPAATARGIQVTSALCLALVEQPVTQNPRYTQGWARPRGAERLATLGEREPRGIELVRAIGIARPFRPPRIVDGPRDLQRLLDLAVIAPHLAPVDRPVRAVAEKRAGFEPLGPETQRHHCEMHRAAADSLA